MQTSQVATHWSRLTDIEDIRPLDESDTVVFAELEAVLRRHKAINRFGITLLHRHFELAEGEVLVESTDCVARTQTVEVKLAREVFDGGRLLQTQWAFADSEGTLVCRGWCHYDQGHRHHHQWSPDPSY
jgi:hypothetical protein